VAPLFVIDGGCRGLIINAMTLMNIAAWMLLEDASSRLFMVFHVRQWVINYQKPRKGVSGIESEPIKIYTE